MFQDQIYVTVTYLLVTVCQFPSVSSIGNPLYLCMQPSKLGLLFPLTYIGSMNADIIHVLSGEG